LCCCRHDDPSESMVSASRFTAPTGAIDMGIVPCQRTEFNTNTTNTDIFLFRLTSCPAGTNETPQRMFTTEATEKAVCSVPVRAYLQVTSHGPRATARELRMNADER
jgi:hypothetical protein